MKTLIWKTVKTAMPSLFLLSCTTGDPGTAKATGQEKTKGEPVVEEVAVIETEYGEIRFRFYHETPNHAKNFKKLANDGFYDSTTFHRVINQFMIQGGDPNSKDDNPHNDGQGGPGYTQKAEIGKFHKRGAVAAARQGDHVNPEKESSGSQFYIVQRGPWPVHQLQLLSAQMNRTFTREQIELYTTIGGTPHLDNEYTVFGEVISGMEVVDQIARVKVDPWSNRPVQEVMVKKVYIEKQEVQGN